ncbi:MAG: SPFH domain-containing protein [Armatimonadia bacterium]
MDLLDVIEWQDVSGTEIVHRWPSYGPGTIRLGAQLTVRESQAAVFFRDGKALDVLGPGRHTLETANIPLLQRIINIPFGGETPFQAEVYFVNMRTLTGLKWGTASPIIFRDSELAMVRLRAKGAFTCRVADPQLFVNEVVGTESRYDTESVTSWLRDFIVSRFNDTLGTHLKTILDLPSQYDEIAAATKSRVGEDFENYGLQLIDFLIADITPPEEVMAMIDQRAGMEAAGDLRKFLQYRTAEAIGKMPEAAGGAGDAAAAGVGIGAGVGMGAAMAGAMRDAFAPTQEQPAAPAVSGATCPQGHPVPAGAKFCPQCGAPVGPKFCASCGKPVPPDAKFCPECGKPVA